MDTTQKPKRKKNSVRERILLLTEHKKAVFFPA
jgi:hypothetical protein